MMLVVLMVLVVLVLMGRRYAVCESMPLGESRDNLSRRLETLDEVWPLMMVLFCSIAVFTAWYLIPSGP